MKKTRERAGEEIRPIDHIIARIGAIIVRSNLESVLTVPTLLGKSQAYWQPRYRLERMERSDLKGHEYVIQLSHEPMNSRLTWAEQSHALPYTQDEKTTKVEVSRSLGDDHFAALHAFMAAQETDCHLADGPSVRRITFEHAGTDRRLFQIAAGVAGLLTLDQRLG